MSAGTRSIYRGAWRIDVTIRPRVNLPVAVAALSRAIAAALDAAGAPAPASVGLILADDRALAALNEEHMGERGPTDVLSFPMLPPAAFPRHAGQTAEARRRDRARSFVLPPGRRVHVGDMVVSVERALAQAQAGRGGQTGDIGWSVAEELRLLVVHGTLHLCGWDHRLPAEEAAMRQLERRILGGLR
ncbi:MAG TPA: rRNA maturation RNase YbeY [Candidatus Limnocylindrales bacterium]